MHFAWRNDRSRDSTLGASMTPMIDVVFLLLVFFLVTASFSADEDSLSSDAASESEGTTQITGPIILEVGAGTGSAVYRIGERRLSSVSELTEVLRALRSDDGLVIRADDDASIASVAAAMQAAEDAGHTKRSYVGRTE